MKGRKPKPTSNQIAAGDPRKLGKRKLEAKLAAEPKAARGLPDCPRHLRGRARAAWNFWREELAAMSLDRRPDAMMLEGACFNYAGAINAEEIIRREGATVTESTIDQKTGKVIVLKTKVHPASQIAAKRWSLVKAFCSEFGLSPVSRTRLAIEKPTSSEDDLMKMLSAPRAPRPVPTVQ